MSEKTISKLLLVASMAVSANAFAGLEWTVKNVAELVTALTELNAAVSQDYTYGYPHKIFLQPGVYDLSEVKMSDDSHLNVGSSLDFTMEGLGEKPGDVVLKGGGAEKGCRVLFNAGGDNYGWSHFKKLTVTGGHCNGYGAGICSYSPKTEYVDCIFSNNVSTCERAGYQGGGGYGGCAIRCLFVDNVHPMAGGGFSTGSAHWDGFTPYVEDCVFSNNQQTVGLGEYYGGGALSSVGPVSNCRFYGNTAMYGGAIGPAEGGVCTPVVSNCVFVGNSAHNYGGATYKVPLVVGCAFTNNVANTQGGGAYGHDMSIYDSSFTSNRTVNYDGGAAFGSGLVVSNCVMTGNYAQGSGGALYFYDVLPSHAYDCSFVGNSCYGYGGAVNLASLSDSSVEGCIFDSNAASANGGYAYGGGVYSSSLGLVTNCTFFGKHQAAGGKAAYNCNVYCSTFRNFEGGGYVLSDCNLYNSFVTNNLCSNFGIWGAERHLESNDSGAPRVSVNCLYADNQVIGEAGYSLVHNKQVVNCTVVNNSIEVGNYGEMYAGCTFVNTVFTGNKANGGDLDVMTRRVINREAMPQALTNCVYSVVESDAVTDLFCDCRQIAKDDLLYSRKPGARYVPRSSSPLRRGALQEPWVLDLVGDQDIYGKTRVFGDSIDIGAVEWVSNGMGFFLSLQ